MFYLTSNLFFSIGSKLFFAKGPNVAPHGMIDLSTCITVKSAEMTAKKKNAFEVSTKEETFYIFADTAKEKDEWIGTIGKSIVQSSNTYTNDDNNDDNSSEEEDD